MASATRKRVLLAELDDRLALQTFRRLFEHNQAYDVLIARSAKVTTALLQSDRFRAVAVRTRAANPEALNRVAQAAPKQTRVVAVTESSKLQDAEALYALGADLVLGDHTSAQTLTEGLLGVSDAQTVLAGSLEELTVPDLLQILCLCRRSLMLRVFAPQLSGVVWLSEGEIHHAVTPDQAGQQALNQLVGLTEGSYAATSLCQAPVRSIQRDWQHVLLEAARIDDEAHSSNSQDQTRESEVRKVSGLHKASGLARYRELTDLGLESVRSGNLTKAREYWKAARELESDADQQDPKKLGTTVA